MISLHRLIELVHKKIHDIFFSHLLNITHMLNVDGQTIMNTAEAAVTG